MMLRRGEEYSFVASLDVRTKHTIVVSSKLHNSSPQIRFAVKNYWRSRSIYMKYRIHVIIWLTLNVFEVITILVGKIILNLN